MTTATRTRKPKRSKPTEADKAARQAEASELHREIALRVQTLSEDAEWLAYLDFMKGFHTYSFNNIMLMMCQRHARGQEMPTLVAGFKAWQDKGRVVRKGERGLRIFGFRSVLVTDADGEPVLDERGRKQFRPFFPVVSVFDIDQTDPAEGKPQVDLGAMTPPLLTGDDVNGITDGVTEWLRSIEWALQINDIGGETRGYTTLDGSKVVAVDANLSPAMRAKTALHEMAHVILHVDKDGMPHPDAPAERAVRELEAESAAYVAGAILGLDTAAYSDRYLLGWAHASGQPAGEAIKATAGRVQKAVAKMVKALGGEE